MTKLLLFHNSDEIHYTFKPRDNNRPMFYWYSDRFASNLGTADHLHIFIVDPIGDNIELRSRSTSQDFDGLHKHFLHFRDFKDGKHPKLFYDEPGIAMSFSVLVPDIILKVHPRDKDIPSFLHQTYEIVHPSSHATTDAYIKLFHSPYDELYKDNPIRFNEIPEILDLIPDINSIMPFRDIAPDKDGKYYYDQWNPMTTHKQGTWL